MNNHIVITGATGVIGVELAQKLIKRGEKVVLLARSPNAAQQKIPGAAAYVRWDSDMQEGEWKSTISGAKAVIHLAGKPLLESRWNEEHKQECYQSRIIGTRHIVAAIAEAAEKPQVFISSSAIGYYGSFDKCSDTAPLTESGNKGSDFLAHICIDWEEEARKAENLVPRLVFLRTGIVLSTRGGMLQKMMTPFQYFAGGPIGTGLQCISWIHMDDEVNAIIASLDNSAYKGAINLVAPTPVSMKEFASKLGAVMGRPSLLQVPEFAVKMLMGEGGEYAVRGQKVLPTFLEKQGFTFRYPDLSNALGDLIKHGK
uniref:TIGR01777 family protein n=1 Tax=Chlorobium chlorochromatii (strain CaD3) TaxID=340177 RepID=Q3AUE8_CHLCH